MGMYPPSWFLDLVVRLDLGGCGIGPGLLVLDRVDGPLFPRVARRVGGHGVGGEPGHHLVAAHVAVLELLVREAT